MDYLIYIGDGTALHDVPARNLTKEEAERFGMENLIASQLYTRPKAQTAKQETPAEVKEK